MPTKKHKIRKNSPHVLSPPPLCLENPEFKAPIDQLSEIFKRRGICAYIFGGAIYKRNPGDIDILLPWSNYDESGIYTGEIDSLIFNLKKVLDLRKRKSILNIAELAELNTLELYFKNSKFNPVYPLIGLFAEMLEQESVIFVEAYTSKKGERSVIKVCINDVDIDFVIADKSIAEHAKNVDFRIGRIYHSLYDNQNYYPNKRAEEESLQDYYNQRLHMTRSPAQMFGEDPSRILRLIRAISSSECTLSEALENAMERYLKQINYQIILDPSRLYHDMTLFFFSGYALRNLALLENKWKLFIPLFGCNYARSEHVVNLTSALIRAVLKLSDQSKAEKNTMPSPSLFYYALHWSLIKQGSALHLLSYMTFSPVNLPMITLEEHHKNCEILQSFEAKYLGSLPAEKSPVTTVAYPINTMEVLNVTAEPFEEITETDSKPLASSIEMHGQEDEKFASDITEKLTEEILEDIVKIMADESIQCENSKALEKQRLASEAAIKKAHEESVARKLREKAKNEKAKVIEKAAKESEKVRIKAEKIAAKAAEKEAAAEKKAQEMRLKKEQAKARQLAEKEDQACYDEEIKKWPDVYKEYLEGHDDSFESLLALAQEYFERILSALKTNILHTKTSINDLYFEWIKIIFNDLSQSIDLHKNTVLDNKVSQYKMLKISYPLLNIKVQEKIAIIEILQKKCIGNKNTITAYFRENKRKIEEEIKKIEALEPDLNAFNADTWQILGDYFSSYKTVSEDQERPEYTDYAKYAEQCYAKSRKIRREDEKKDTAAQREEKKESAIDEYNVEVEQSEILYEQWKSYSAYELFSAITVHFQDVINRFELRLREFFSLSIAYTRFINIICAEVEEALLVYNSEEDEQKKNSECPIEQYKKKMRFVLEIEKKQEYIEQLWSEYKKYQESNEIKTAKNTVISLDAQKTRKRIKELNKKIKLLKESSPDFSEKIWYELGVYFEKKGENKSAEDCYHNTIKKVLEKKAIQEPFFYWAYCRIAETKLDRIKNDKSLLLNNKHFEELIEYYWKSLECVSKLPEAKEIRCFTHMRLAEIEYLKGNYLRSAEYCEEILGLSFKKLMHEADTIELGTIYVHTMKKSEDANELIVCGRLMNNAGLIVNKPLFHCESEDLIETLLSTNSLNKAMETLHVLGELTYYGCWPNHLISKQKMYWECGKAYEAAGHWQKAVYHYSQSFSIDHWDSKKLTHLLEIIACLAVIKRDSLVSINKYNENVINAIQETIHYFNEIVVNFNIFLLNILEFSKNIHLSSTEVQQMLKDYEKIISKNSLPQAFLTQEVYETTYQLGHGSYQKYLYQYYLQQGDVSVALKDSKKAKKYYEKATELGFRLPSVYEKLKSINILNEELEHKKMHFLHNSNKRFLSLVNQGHYFKLNFNSEKARNAYFKALEETSNGLLLEESERKKLLGFYSDCYTANSELSLAEHYFHSAEKAKNASDDAQALVYYYKAVEVDPKHYLAHVKLALYYNNLSTPEPEKALIHYRAFMKLPKEQFPYEYSVIYGSYDQCLGEMLTLLREAGNMLTARMTDEDSSVERPSSPSRFHGGLFYSQTNQSLLTNQDVLDVHENELTF